MARLTLDLTLTWRLHFRFRSSGRYYCKVKWRNIAKCDGYFLKKIKQINEDQGYSSTNQVLVTKAMIPDFVPEILLSTEKEVEEEPRANTALQSLNSMVNRFFHNSVCIRKQCTFIRISVTFLSDWSLLHNNTAKFMQTALDGGCSFS